MHIDFLLNVFREKREKIAIISKGKRYTYKLLLKEISSWSKRFKELKINNGDTILIKGDFSFKSIAILLALIQKQCIIIPFTTHNIKLTEAIRISNPKAIISISKSDKVQIKRETKITHPLYQKLKAKRHPGLVLFSSGSTGIRKAALHDLSLLLEKYMTRRHDFVTILFLLFDHIGGFDTLLYSLSNGSTVVCLSGRSPEIVCTAIEKYQAQVLPTTPTFLNLLIISQSYKNYDLSSLKYITYGTEIMPQTTLREISKIFPKAIMLQKYGTTEFGTLRSKSKSSKSLWVKIGGENIQTKVVNGILYVKSNSSLVGYLNYPTPYTQDGWINTGDKVLVKGKYLKFLGRQSEIINVGGRKLYPAEVENIICKAKNVAEVSVYGEPNPIIGNIVCATIRPIKPETQILLERRIKLFCFKKLPKYKIPIKIIICDKVQYSQRYKKVRFKENG